MNTRIVFIIAFVAIFLGIASLTGVFSPDPQPVKQQAPVETRVSFWQAQHAIVKGQSVTMDDFVEHTLPLSQAIHLDVHHNQPVRFESSMVARHPIQADEVIVSGDFATPNSSDYISLITPPGKVAYPISVNSEELDVMLVQPNDYMDVMLLSSPGGNVNQVQSSVNALNHLSVSLLFKSVKVIAVPKSRDDSKYSSVLVALDQAQVAKLVIARRIGQIYIYHTGAGIPQDFDDIQVRDVLPSYSSVRELRGTSSSRSNLQGEVSR